MSRTQLARRLVATSLFALIATFFSSTFAAAQSVENFYKGKTVTVLAGFDASGNAGQLVRTVAAHLGKHLPGNPTVIPQYRPGAGGIVQANYIYNIAPKDGTVIGLLFDNLPMAQVIEPAGIKFDAKRFTIVGAVNHGDNAVIAVRSDHKAQTIQQARTQEVVIGATGPGTTGYVLANILNGTIGTRFRVVTGYTSGGTLLLALERGEIHALARDYDSFVREGPHLIKSGLINWMVQIGGKADPGIPNVPLLNALAETDEQRQVFELVTQPRRMGKAFIGPPGVPEDRVRALQEAFANMLRDPLFIQEAERLGNAVETRSWKDVADVIHSTVDTNAAIAAITRKLIAR